MVKLRCDDCGVIEYVLFDGYNFGDTLLEGVMFEARFAGKDATGAFDYEVKVAAGHEAHWSKLNAPYWLGQAKEYVPDLDIAECPKCHEDVVMPGFGGVEEVDATDDDED